MFIDNILTHINAYKCFSTITATQWHMLRKIIKQAQYFTALLVHSPTVKLWQCIQETVSLSRGKKNKLSIMLLHVDLFFMLKNKQGGFSLRLRVWVWVWLRKRGSKEYKETKEQNQGGNIWYLKWRWHKGLLPPRISRISWDGFWLCVTTVSCETKSHWKPLADAPQNKPSFGPKHTWRLSPEVIRRQTVLSVAFNGDQERTLEWMCESEREV